MEELAGCDNGKEELLIRPGKKPGLQIKAPPAPIR
jgi:hypothetical protein